MTISEKIGALLAIASLLYFYLAPFVHRMDIEESVKWRDMMYDVIMCSLILIACVIFVCGLIGIL